MYVCIFSDYSSRRNISYAYTMTNNKYEHVP